MSAQAKSARVALRQLLAAAVVLFSFAQAKVTTAQVVPGPWALTWSAEFNAGSSDLVPWTFETGGGGWGNQEKQVYSTSSQNVSVSGGAMQITAIATGTGPSQTYTSA